jgi:hypothetical protein
MNKIFGLKVGRVPPTKNRNQRTLSNSPVLPNVSARISGGQNPPYVWKMIEQSNLGKIEIRGTKNEQIGKTASAKTPLENPVIYGENEMRVRRAQENLGKHPYVSFGKTPPIRENAEKTRLSDLKRNPNAPARQPIAKRNFRLKRYLAALAPAPNP